MTLRAPLRSFIGSALLTVAVALTADAQTSHMGDRVGSLHATRAELEYALSDSEQRAAAPGLRGEDRATTRAEAELMRRRLQEGDFQVGDQVALYVEGHADLSVIYTVEPSRSISLPGIGSVPLSGVLRSELETHLSEYLGQYLRDPYVRASSTIRVMVVGGVQKPGYYSVPSHALVTDIIEEAGGTGRHSLLSRIRIERDGQRLIGDRQLQDAIIAGRTLDQLNVQAGDRLVVPEARTVQVRELMGIIGGLGGVATLIWTLRGRR